MLASATISGSQAEQMPRQTESAKQEVDKGNRNATL